MVFLAGVLFGGLAGAAVVWSLAPRARKQAQSRFQEQDAKLRHQVVESMEEMATETGAKAQRVTDSVNHGIGELQQRTQNMVNEGGK